MKPRLIERFKIWVCSVIGHKFDHWRMWEHNGNSFNTCQRCRHVINTTHDKI